MIDRSVQTTSAGDFTCLRQDLNWYPSESTGTWTRGNSGTLQLRLPEAAGEDLHLHLDVRRFPLDQDEPGKVELTCNGMPVGSMHIGNDWQVASVPLPASVLLPGAVNEITLTLRGDGMNRDAEVNGDSRDLGLMLRTFCLSRHPCPPGAGDRGDATTAAGTPVLDKFRLRIPSRRLARWLPGSARRRGNGQTPTKTKESAAA